MSLCSYTEKIVLHGPVDKVFHYFTDTDQIAGVLPPSLNLQIIHRTSRHLTQGSSIHFQARILGIPVEWKSYVHSFSPKRHIAYMWQRSFLRSWEHDYYFEALAPNQTRITECVLYHLPMGFLGKWINRLFFRPWIHRIFTHRTKALQEHFSNAPPHAETRARTRKNESPLKSTPRYSNN